jgi:hypothetical protein
MHFLNVNRSIKVLKVQHFVASILIHQALEATYCESDKCTLVGLFDLAILCQPVFAVH